MTNFSLSDVFFCWLALLCHAIWCASTDRELSRMWLWSSLRAVVQLGALSFALVFLFERDSWAWSSLAIAFMVSVSAWTVAKRSSTRPRRLVKDCALSLLFGLTLTFVPLLFWFPEKLARSPTFIPFFGILLGNSLSGLCLGLAQWERDIGQRRTELEYWIGLGATPQQATKPLQASVIKTAMTSVLNSMVVAGIVSIPGQMTGQLLAGGTPQDAVRTQLVLVFLMSCLCFSSTWLALRVGLRRHFDRWGALVPGGEAL